MVKRFLTLLSVISLASATYAQVVPNGYYRLQNVNSERYAVVMDNTGSVDIQSTSVDLGAIHTFKDFDGNIVSNPGSIIYFNWGGDSNGRDYDLRGQGASTYAMTGYYIKIRKASSNPDTYYAYGSVSGQTLYIGDMKMDGEEGRLIDNGGRQEWYIHPVTTDGDNFFGVRPTYEADGSHYQPFYASFPFTFASDGMKAYYITKYGYGMAAVKEYTGETLPASMPMIIECASTAPKNNRLNLLASTTASKPSDNILTGTYFNNEWPSNHINRVENDPNTIRMLGKTASGELGFVRKSKTAVKYVPANTAYLVVKEGTDKELKLVSEEEYDRIVAEMTQNPDKPDDPNTGDNPDNPGTGIVTVNSESETTAGKGIYTITGVKIAEGNTLPDNAPAGIYIIGGKKILKR